MISDLDESIRKILVEAGGFKPNEVDVSFDIPNREWSTGISRPTLNCYLFDIRENRDLRQHGMENMGKNGQVAFRQRPSSYFDLTYLVTAWTREVEDEHRLLWYALQTLMRFDRIPIEYLQGTLLESEMPIYARTAMPEGVLKSPGEFWTALENQIKPSVSYVVTLALQRDRLPVGPPVLTSHLRVTWPGGRDERWVWFGGFVRDEAGAPIPGATVELVADQPPAAGADALDSQMSAGVVASSAHTLRAITDRDGRFRLRVPGPGRYKLTARAGKFTQEREIDIPDTSYDIKLG
jgi:hypothetical protein